MDCSVIPRRFFFFFNLSVRLHDCKFFLGIEMFHYSLHGHWTLKKAERTGKVVWVLKLETTE